MIQNHLLPNHGSLPDVFQCLVFSLSKSVQRLFKRLSRGSQRFLGFGIVRVALYVDFITASTEVTSREELRRVHQQVSRELDGLRRGKTELPSGRLVGVRRPRCGLGARNVFREGLGNNRSMAGSINLGDDVDTTLEVETVNNIKLSPMVKSAHLIGIIDDICNLR